MLLRKNLEKGGLLDKLTSLHGPSGYEGQVRSFIRDYLMSYVDEIVIDRMGNIIVHKKGSGKRVIVDAHMDEVGFIITGYNDDGTLRFRALGGIDSKIIPAKTVLIGPSNIPGVIGVKPIHLQDKGERQRGLTYDDCCIDIGTNTRAETEKFIELGEYVVFDTEYDEFGEGLVKGKGTAIKFMDKSMIIHQEVKYQLEEVYKKIHKKPQYIFGKEYSDGKTIHKEGNGVKSGTIVYPVRYKNTNMEMVNYEDIEEGCKVIFNYVLF